MTFVHFHLWPFEYSFRSAHSKVLLIFKNQIFCILLSIAYVVTLIILAQKLSNFLSDFTDIIYSGVFINSIASPRTLPWTPIHVFNCLLLSPLEHLSHRLLKLNISNS